MEDDKEIGLNDIGRIATKSLHVLINEVVGGGGGARQVVATPFKLKAWFSHQIPRPDSVSSNLIWHLRFF